MIRPEDWLSQARSRRSPDDEDQPARTRDVVVIGASAGGIEVLTAIASQLPEDLAAALFVVLHMPADHRSFLPEILNRVGPIPAAQAADGEAVRRGRFYVAPPDAHLLVKRGRVRVTFGPRENGHRPAVDPLFRSAAVAYGPQVVGVLLSGALDDGTAGMAVIKRYGGRTVVLDPAEAKYPSMPANAIEAMEIDHVVPVRELAPTVMRLVSQPLEQAIEPPPGEVVDTTEEDPLLQGDDVPGVPVGLTCPECHGALFQSSDEGVVRYHCHVGHRFSPDSLAAAQTGELEVALWTALRSLEESARLAVQMAKRAARNGRQRSEERFRSRADDLARRASIVRHVLLDREAGPRPEPDAEALDVLRWQREADDDSEVGG